MFDRPFRPLVGMGMAIQVVALTSCSHAVTPPERPPVSIAPPPSERSSDPSNQPEITGVWTEFWSSWSLDQRPQEQWLPVLTGVSDSRMADQLVQRKTQDLARGVRLYGQVQPHVTAVQAVGDQAGLIDCQDTSHAGQADLAEHSKTVGVARNRVLGMLVRTPGGWRVSRVDFPGGGC